MGPWHDWMAEAELGLARLRGLGQKRGPTMF
jgi:hypothetical protein